MSSASTSSIDFKEALTYVRIKWDKSILKSLSDYISIPNQSPAYDKEVLTNGYMDKAIALLMDWVKAQDVPGLAMRLVTADGRTPIIFIEVEGEGKTSETVLMYGHMDKQPPMTDGWHEGTGPYTPVLKNGRLYGRGGADDGYSIYSAITAIQALKAQKQPHARIVIIIEACEESGSKDLEHYIRMLKTEISIPSFVICLDSGCGNYNQLWVTATLRGMAYGKLTVSVSREGVHSGGASGIIPSSFRIVRQLLDRVEDAKTGKILAKSLHCDIPTEHYAYAKATAAALGDSIVTDFPFLPGVQPMHKDYSELLLNKCWRPTLSYVGVDGMKPTDDAGNVLRPSTTLGLSFRLPPTVNGDTAVAELKQLFESNPPEGAHVTFEVKKAATGWMAPKMDSWLENSIQSSSRAAFGKDAMIWGEGGTIPFMGMLGEMFPGTQFFVTGVLGPASNAHGPNEFLHVEMFHNVTVCVAAALADHYRAKVSGNSK